MTLDDPDGVAAASGELLEQRLAAVSAAQPQFAAVLRAYSHRAAARATTRSRKACSVADGPAQRRRAIKRAANLKGEIDHTARPASCGAARGAQQIGRTGLVLVLDEVETIQRMRADAARRG